MLRIVFKSLAARSGRLLMTAVSIVLGVAFVTGVFALKDTSTTLLERQYTNAAAGVDAVVRDASVSSLGTGYDVERKPVAEDVLARVERIDGVAAAEGVVIGSAPLVINDRVVPVTDASIGGSWAEAPFAPYRIVRGRSPVAPGEVVIDEATAQANDVSIGDPIAVSVGEKSHAHTVVGTVGFGKDTGVNGSTVALFSPDAAQSLFGLEGEWSEIAVVADDGIDASELQRRLASALGAQVFVATTQDIAAARADAAASDLRYFTLILLVLAATALIVAAFLIANTFAIVVAQRTRELATLRALGATGRSVTMSVVAEALVIGVGASIAGVGVGIAAAAGLRALARTMGIVVPDGSIIVQPATVAAGIMLGIGVTLIAALMPARIASRVPPVAAMRGGVAPHRGPSKGRGIAGGIVLALGGMLVAMGSASSTVPLVALGSVVALGGAVMLAPSLTVLSSRVVGRMVGRSRVTSMLARANVGRAAQRTAATSAVLAVGLAVVTFMTVIATSAKVAVAQGFDEVMTADLVIEGPAGQMGGLPPEVYERIATVPGVAAASRTRHGHAATELMMMIPLKAVDPKTLPSVIDLDMVAGSLDGLGRGGVVLTEKAAALHRVSVGRDLVMSFPSAGRQTLPVVGIISDNSAWPLMAEYFISLNTLDRYLGAVPDATVYVAIADNAERAAVAEAIETALTAYPSVRVEDHAQLRAREMETFDAILGLVGVLLLLAVLVALMGIMNSLALSVLERTREIGLLRAIGMSRRDVGSMIRLEAALTTIVGGLAGLSLGLVTSIGMVRALAESKVIALTVPVLQLSAYLAVAVLGGVIAGAVPGRRAARMNPLSAIAASE